jgi:hypothetical protein
MTGFNETNINAFYHHQASLHAAPAASRFGHARRDSVPRAASRLPSACVMAVDADLL